MYYYFILNSKVRFDGGDIVDDVFLSELGREPVRAVNGEGTGHDVQSERDLLSRLIAYKLLVLLVTQFEMTWSGKNINDLYELKLSAAIIDGNFKHKNS